MAGDDRLRELEKKYEGYKVYDKDGQSIGKVDDLLMDDGDHEEYIGVKMGLFGLSGMTWIPMEIARVNEGDRVIEVSESKERVKDAPHYSDDEIDGSFEGRIRRHFGLLTGGSASASSYGRPTGAEGAAGDNTIRGGDMETSGAQPREPVAREQYRNDENYVSDSAMGAAAGGAATGGMSDLETGEGRGKQRKGSSSRSSNGAASEYFGVPVAEPGEKEFEDMQDHRSASTGFGPDCGGAGLGASGGEGSKPEDFAGAPVGEPGGQEFRAFQGTQEADAVGSQAAIGEPGRPRVRRRTQRGC